MLWKTHLAIALAAALYFSSHVNDPTLFVGVVLISNFFPEIDSGFSHMRKKGALKSLQTTQNRRILHTYTACIILSLAIALLYPVLALPFFVGYSFHLFADSFTTQGIRPFWPIKTVSKGMVSTGGKIDNTIFYTFVIIDIILLITILYTSI